MREFLLGGPRMGRFVLHCSNGLESLPIRLGSLRRLGHLSGCKFEVESCCVVAVRWDTRDMDDRSSRGAVGATRRLIEGNFSA